jgi:aldose 1-epimerase
MFNIAFSTNQNSNLTSCIISNENGTKAVLHPELGASLQQLYFNNKAIINNIIEKDGAQKYLNSSCSAVLFPFANRINDGQFSYKNHPYQLECNEPSRGHAIHGLVYRKPFEMATLSNSDNQASVSFSYAYNGEDKGFPFPFNITLIYTLNENSLHLEVRVKNTGTTSFPFSLGWHPYFYSNNLEESILYMESEQEVIANERMIPIKTTPKVFPNPLVLKNQEFDDAFVLKNNTIGYKTPDYKINIKTQQDNTTQYIQLYIPSHRQSIAIEPMTAPADCYNNNIGTKELKAKESYVIAWIVEEVLL